MLSVLLIIVLGGRSRSPYASTILFAGGLACQIAADTIFGMVSATGSYASGGLVEALWAWGPLLFSGAVYASLLGQSTPSSSPRRVIPGWIIPYLPYVAVLSSYSLLLASELNKTSSTSLQHQGILWGTTLATTFVIVRQVVAFADNARLTRQLQLVSSQLELRVAQRTSELQELSLNLEQKVQERTAALEASQQQLLAAEKLASLGRLSAGLAHEINTPLAAAMNYLLQARTLAAEYQASIGVSTVSEDDHRELASELRTALAEASATLQRIGEFLRKVRGQTRATDLGAMAFDPIRAASETLAMLEHRAQSAGVRLQLASSDQALRLYGEPGRFEQVLTNLLSNAIDACEGRQGKAEVRFSLQGERVLMSVEDSAEGIAQSVLPKIFEPMFTTKQVGKGEGLGLAIVHDIVRGHFGGEIEVSSRQGAGTTVRVSFPSRASSEYSSVE